MQAEDFAIRTTELDLKRIAGKHFHHRAYRASGEVQCWFIVDKGDGIQKGDVGHKGIS